MWTKKINLEFVENVQGVFATRLHLLLVTTHKYGKLTHNSLAISGNSFVSNFLVRSTR